MERVEKVRLLDSGQASRGREGADNMTTPQEETKPKPREQGWAYTKRNAIHYFYGERAACGIRSAPASVLYVTYPSSDRACSACIKRRESR